MTNLLISDRAKAKDSSGAALIFSARSLSDMREFARKQPLEANPVIDYAWSSPVPVSLSEIRQTLGLRDDKFWQWVPPWSHGCEGLSVNIRIDPQTAWNFSYSGKGGEVTAATRSLLEVVSRVASERLSDIERSGAAGAQLTKREDDTLRLAAAGKSDAEIGATMGITARTVRFHIDNAKEKFGVYSRTQAVLKILRGERHDSVQPRATMLRGMFSSFLDEAFEAHGIPQLGRSLSALAERFGYKNCVILDAAKLDRGLGEATLFTTRTKREWSNLGKAAPFVGSQIQRLALVQDGTFTLGELQHQLGSAADEWMKRLPPEMQASETLLLPVHREKRLVMVAGCAGLNPDVTPIARAMLHTAAHVLYDRWSSSEAKGASKNMLTKREAECMRWIGLGKLDREIAEIVGITERTVRFHARNAKKKLGAVTRLEAIAKLAGGTKSRV
ncbi:MAG: LuxR C-terminal-related transcriptional regulator [Micropepsaceae bacterium]